MRKNINKIVGLTLCIGMLTGCAQTPESSLVKPKGSKAEDAYTEAEGVDMVKEDSSENTKDKNTAVRTTIRDLLNAPETYKSQTTDDSAKLVVNTDATVEIPDVEKISAISVTPAEVTQDLLDRITDAFFSEAKLYTSDSYYTQTKDEIKKTLDELKEETEIWIPITMEQMKMEIIFMTFMEKLRCMSRNMSLLRKRRLW